MIVTEKIYNTLDVTFLEDIMVYRNFIIEDIECLCLSERCITVYSMYTDIKILCFKNVALLYYIIIIAAMPNTQQRRRRFEILFIISTNSLSFPSLSLASLHDYNDVSERLCYNFYVNYISHYIV